MLGIILAGVWLIGCGLFYAGMSFLGWFTGWWKPRDAAETSLRLAEFAVDIATHHSE